MFTILKNVRILLCKSKCRMGLKNLTSTVTGKRIKRLNEDTLTGRFLLYMKHFKSIEDLKHCDASDLISTLKYNPRDIEKFDTNQVIQALTLLSDIGNRQDYTNIFSLIDNECCKRMKEFDINETISLLHSFMVANPNRLVESDFFNIAMIDLMEIRNQLTKDELVELIFFIGLLKKCTKSQTMLKCCMKQFDKKFISKLTQEDLCIICNSYFKTSTRLKNQVFLNQIKHYINENLALLKDPALFITLIKTLRHNRCQDDDILATIRSTMFFNKTIECYSFPAMSHILALFADYLYYDEAILKVFSEKCITLLKNSVYISKSAYLLDQPRIKDIKRFLWSLSNLNFKLNRTDIENVILPQIFKRLTSGEFRNDPGTLIDCILYLWMMEFRAYDLIKEVVNKDQVNLIKGHNPTSERNLNLLLTCIYYEERDLYNSLKLYPNTKNNYVMSKQLKKRPLLEKIVNNVKISWKENDLDKFDLQCQVPQINIIGITGFRNKIYRSVNIEVLDEYTCLKHLDGAPTGLMALKLRILEKCNEALIVLEESDVMQRTNSELQDILMDELSLVC